MGCPGRFSVVEGLSVLYLFLVFLSLVSSMVGVILGCAVVVRFLAVTDDFPGASVRWRLSVAVGVAR